MKKTIDILDSYFEDEEFLVNELDESKATGVLGPNATEDQKLKYEITSLISRIIKDNNYSNAEAGKIISLDAGDVSRLVNLHIDRFTLDRLLRILSILCGEKSMWESLAKISQVMSERVA